MSTSMATAIAKGSDSRTVAEHIVQEALQKLSGKPVSLAILFCSSEYDYQTVVSVIYEKIGSALLIGCSSAGEFTEKEDKKQGIALSLIASDDLKFFTGMGKKLQEDPIASLQQAVSHLPQTVEGFPHRTAILLHDGLVGKGEEAVMGAMIALGPTVSFAGGSAADDLKFNETHVFLNDTVSRDCALVCLIASKEALPIGFKHGHLPFSETLTSTKAVDSTLFEVNGRPAWDVWKDVVREKARELDIDVDSLVDESAVGQFLIRYELGLSMGSDYKVRVPLSKNPDGSLNFACTIPEGASFRIMESRIEDQIASSKTAAENALAAVKGKKLAGAIVFDCVCRGIILGDRFYEGVEEIKKVVGPIPIIGFETYGEICMERGQFSGYHNTSTVVLLIPA